VFAALERNALRSLPAEPFDMSQWSRALVNIDYHIAFDANFYSVPYTPVHELVEVRSQLPVSRWHEQIGDPTLADGILDRLVHNAHRIEMRGESMRKQRGEKGEE
jgi:hypothetical protein